MTETCPLCNQPLTRAKFTDQWRCDTKTCVLYAHPQKTIREVRAIIHAAELRGFEQARDMAAAIAEDEKIPEYMPDAGTIERDFAVAEKIRAMKMESGQ